MHPHNTQNAHTRAETHALNHVLLRLDKYGKIVELILINLTLEDLFCSGVWFKLCLLVSAKIVSLLVLSFP